MATVTSVYLSGYPNRNVAWNIYRIVKHRIRNCDRVVRQDKKIELLRLFLMCNEAWNNFFLSNSCNSKRMHAVQMKTIKIMYKKLGTLLFPCEYLFCLLNFILNHLEYFLAN